MILTIILVILLIILIYLTKNINEDFVNSNLYKKIDNDFYNKVFDVSEPKYNKILKFESNDSKINVKLESNDYLVEEDGNNVNIKNIVNPQKDILYSDNIFSRMNYYDDKELRRLFNIYKDDYVDKSELFFRKN